MSKKAQNFDIICQKCNFALSSIFIEGGDLPKNGHFGGPSNTLRLEFDEIFIFFIKELENLGKAASLMSFSQHKSKNQGTR